MKSSLKFNSSIENISIIESMIEEIADKKIIKDDMVGNVMVCVTEAVTNAINHGNNNDINKNVLVNYTVDNHKLIFKVTDQGKGFDYTRIPDPTLPENIEKEDGRGIFLIRNLADELDFENHGKDIIFKFYL